jgi:hypothetical protein
MTSTNTPVTTPPERRRLEEKEKEAYALTYLSFGAGVQSTALLVMSALGDHRVPRADVAIFADTGDEPTYVYEQVERMRAWSTIPVVTVSAGQLGATLLARARGTAPRAASIPAFVSVGNGGQGTLRRNCTHDYKLVPLRRYARSLTPRGKRARALIGISIDESVRMKDSRDKWIDNTYPLVDAGLTREECLVYLREHGFDPPRKSACVFCPYHDDPYWIDLRDKAPDDFARAVAFDRGIRDMTRSGVKHPVYLHRSMKPLAEVAFKPKRDDGQLPLWQAFSSECEGLCGV